MRIAHLADLHLGYRAYHRAAPGGINLRERDVAQAFRSAVERVVELEPDLVLVAGDVFHSVRPPNAAIADAFRQFARLRARLPDAPVVVIAGNHDSPRSVEAGSILRLLAEIPGVSVVEGEARAVHLPELDATVFCVPHAAVREDGDRIAWEPDAAASINVLMLHGCVSGTGVEGRLRFLGEYGGASVDIGALRPERWDYVALGHYHIHTRIAPNLCYAGSLERTSPNIWEEAEVEKGFVTFDTSSGELAFQRIEARPVIDLPRISARLDANGAGPRFIGPEQLDAFIRDRVDGIAGGLEGRIVRLVLEDVPRELFRELDHRRIRQYKAQALHFHLDVRRPKSAAVVATDPEQRRTLEEEVAEFLQHRWAPSTRAIERDRLVELAAAYLERAGPATEAELEDGLEAALADEPGHQPGPAPEASP